MENKVLAAVGGVNITEEDVSEAIIAMGQRGESLNNPQGRAMVLEQLINRKLLLAGARKELLEFDPEFKKQLNIMKEELLTKFAISRAIENVKVTDEEAKKFYDENPAAFVSGNTVTLDSVSNVIEGMVVDFMTPSSATYTEVSGATGRRILSIDRANKVVTVNGGALTGVVDENDIVTVQGSFGKEITGLGAIFGNSTSLYGITRSENLWLTPKTVAAKEGVIDDSTIQKVVDELEDVAGSTANFIVCNSGVRRAYQNYLTSNRTNVDTINLDGGFKAISFGGIPVVTDRFSPSGNMYVLNTDEFTLHQLCDWRWLEGDDGRVLKQTAGKPVYTATLVKYADLLCEKPSGQGVITGITEA